MSLSGKIILFTIGVICVVGLILGGHATYVSTSAARKTYEKKAQETSRNLAALIEADLDGLRVDRINRTIENLLRDPEIDGIRIYLPDGILIADGQTYPSASRLRKEIPEVQRAVHTGENLSLVLPRQRVEVGHLTTPGGDPKAVTVLSLSREFELYGVKIQQFRAILFSGLLILFGSVFGGYFARSLTRPLQQLTAAIEHAAGDAAIDTSKAENRSDEIGQLARTYRTAEAKLEKHNQELEQSRRELEEAKVAAETAAKSKSDFLANMSHEIRTPLNGLIGLTQVLMDQNPREDQRDLLETISASGDGLLAIVDELLDFSKIEAGRLIIRPGPCDLPKIAGEALRLFGPRMHERGVVGTLEVAPDFPSEPLFLDAQRVRQVLQNLVSNAVKFTDEGEIRVRLSASPGRGSRWTVRCEVRDTGPGIDQHQIQRIFERFTQVDESSSRHYGGTGLGLAICHRLVELMNGHLEVSSAIGEGSSFVFTLPTREAGYLEREDGYNPPLGDLHLPRQRVLVVEDNQVNRRVVSLMLERLEQDTVLVNNGFDAIKAVREEVFDLILMDVQMPEMDGIETTRRIRALPDAKAQPPIIALTAHVLTADRDICLGAGMNAFLTKPLRRDALHQILAEIAQRGAMAFTPKARN